MKKNPLTIIALLFSLLTFSQNEITISYGETLSFGEINKNTHFYITSSYDKVHLKGNKINDHKFEKPGSYTIKIDEHHDKNEHECLALPKEIVVIVSRVKMTFDSSKINFSSPIRKNIETTGITLSIPVNIETYDNLPVQMNFTKVNSAGIGTTIVANLDAAFKELSIGKHVIKYFLSGIVSQNSYLMFDFIDADGKIQPVSLLHPVND